MMKFDKARNKKYRDMNKDPETKMMESEARRIKAWDECYIEW